MGAKIGRACSVKLGSTKTLGLGTWTISGIDADQFEDSEFGDTYKTHLIGFREGGTVAFTGYYDPADTTGQTAMKTYWKNGTEITSMRFYVDATSYWGVHAAESTANHTEQDVQTRMTLTSAKKITMADLDDDEEVWLYIDKTAGYFNGNFEFNTQVNCTANAASDDTCGLWAITNTVDTLTDIDAATGDYLAVYWEETGGSDYIKLEECNAGSLTVDTSSAVSKATEYYLKIKRDESVGTYGTIYCYIYTVGIDGTLFDTLTVTLTKKQDFRYLFWMIAHEAGTTGCAWDGTIQNLKLVTGGIEVTSWDVSADKSALMACSFTGKVTGRLILQ